MYFVHSDDGTEIACRNLGQGSPVLLVHATADDSARWDPVLPMLTQRFTVYMMDRRGRGASSDTEPYAVEREFEDVAAVLDAIGRPVAVIGHAFGALVALEAARLSRHVRKLVFYEPATRPPELNPYPNGTSNRLDELVAEGRREEALTFYLHEALQVSLAELELLQEQVGWQRRLASVPTIGREVRAHAAYTFDPARFRGLAVPALLIVGSRSPEAAHIQTDAARSALRYAQTTELANQGQTAIDTSPGLFVRAVVEFLRDTW